ncbi:hypothetical protein CYMTET_46778, partial [Cymbomonas tetramitiformis]
VDADVADAPNHEGYWIRLDQWNRFRHDTYKDDRQAELRFIPATTVSAASNDVDDELETEERAPVYANFTSMGETEHLVNTGKKKGTTTKCYLWKCDLCKSNPILKVFGGSTGVLFKHLDRYHPNEYALARKTSKHSKCRVDENGVVVEIYSFKDSLPQHVKFVLFIVLDLMHFHMSRSSNFRTYSAGLDGSYVPCCRDTSEKILSIIFTLMRALLGEAIDAAKARFGEPFAGFQSDIWSPKDCTTSYCASRLSFVAKHDGKNFDVAPCIGFDQFPENSHTGDAISRYLVILLAIYNLTMEKSITLPTLDGASNNKKAFAALKKKAKVCFPHHLQRAIQHGLGSAGQKKNPTILSHIKRNARQSRSFHCSVKHALRLQQAQKSRGVKSCRTKRVYRQHQIRWGGLYRMLRQNRHLESDIKLALTGSREGTCSEHPAFYVSDLEEEPSASATIAAVVTVNAACDDEESADVCSQGEDSDIEQVEANEAKGNEYSLQHRCLGNLEWKKNNLLESLLTTPYEVSEAVQGHTGSGLDKAYILATTLHAELTADVVAVVSGSDDTETWENVHARSLPTDLQQFRSVTASELKERVLGFDKDVLLSLKMNPSIDTGVDGVIFNDMSATVEMMEGEYNRQLRFRGKYLLTKGWLNTPSNVQTSDTASVVDLASPAPESVSKPAPKRRRTLAELATSFIGTTPVIELICDGADSTDALLTERIRSEKDSFAALCKAAVSSGKYVVHATHEFDQFQVYCDYEQQIPIHTAVYFADCCSKKCASANVEQLFSNAGTLLADFHSGGLSPEMLEMYMFVRANWQYKFLQPSVADIVSAYIKTYNNNSQQHGYSEDENSDDENE